MIYFVLGFSVFIKNMINKLSTKVDQLVFRPARERALRLPIVMPKAAGPLSATLYLVYSFAFLILIGSLLLVFPFSSTAGEFTSPVDTFFTATSAVCVTGLSIVDSGTYWSGFGQGVILALFQIGGLGFIIGATLLLIAIGGRFGLKERVALSETMGMDQPGGILSIVIKVSVFSFIIEAIGVFALYARWSAMGYEYTSFWNAIFHSISAYNNCGMDIFGSFSSLASFQGDTITLLTIALLVIIGSTGYVFFADVFRSRGFSRISLNSKIVMVTTLALLFIGTLFYLLAESSNPATLQGMPFPQKLMVSFFHSVTARSAGFSVMDVGAMAEISLFFTMFLMMVGGATGSVTGGVKVNSIGILAITVYNLFRGKENIEAFGRQLNRQMIYRAAAFVIAYIIAAAFFVTLLWITESFPIDKIIFEVFSATGTVGLSTGITPELTIAGRIITVFAMFTGRVGPLVFMAYLAHRKQPTAMEYPYENVRLG